MKRMVENSEKLEEIANRINILSDDELMIYKDIEIEGRVLLDGPVSADGSLTINGPTEFNDTTNYYGHATFDEGLTTSNITTSNITTPGGLPLNIINEEDYSISNSGLNMGISTMNLGIAIAVTASISAGEQNGEYTIMSFNTDKLNNSIGVVQMSGNPVCVVEKSITNNTMTIIVRLNKNKAEYTVADYYNFSFILGHIGKEI